MDLARGKQRVEDAAGVVDTDEPLQRCLAGVDVDLDDGDVGAERERRLGGGEVGRAGDRTVEARRELVQVIPTVGVPATWNLPA